MSTEPEKPSTDSDPSNPSPTPPGPPPEDQAPATTTTATTTKPGDRKLIAGILAILLGSLGVHKFYLGYQKEGIIMLVVTLIAGGLTCGAGAGIMGIIGIVEGILYLTKTDSEFEQTYVTGNKPWF